MHASVKNYAISRLLLSFPVGRDRFIGFMLVSWFLLFLLALSHMTISLLRVIDLGINSNDCFIIVSNLSWCI